MEHLTLDQTASTNSYLKERTAAFKAPIAVRAIAQNAGRGQRGNSWEAAPGENLTFSILWRPDGVAPRDQFSVSEAVALGVTGYLGQRGIEARVKWPNDIYVGDRKICGILIEHSILGSELDHSIIGVGINVNQTLFTSDAPNPVSMSQLTGLSYDLDREMQAATEMIEKNLLTVSTAEGRAKTHERFLASLWRGDGRWYLFRDCSQGAVYKGRIEDVEPSGYMLIRDERGNLRRYAFKEVEYIL